MKLVLFDIDGTILESGGAGVRSLDYAFRDALGRANVFSDICMAGKTDLQIVREGLRKIGLPSDNGLIPQILESYISHLKREILESDKHLKPGVIEALQSIKLLDGKYKLGLLTGNFEEGARIKLGAFGLNDFFPLGAYGSDHEDRNKLLPIAVRRFNNFSGISLNYSDCIIVGDTPLDVACAKPYNARCIAVATGPYEPQSLSEAGADFVMDNLSDTKLFLEALNELSA